MLQTLNINLIEYCSEKIVKRPAKNETAALVATINGI